MSRLAEIRDRLNAGKVVLLDGAVGTELDRRGFSTQRPGWSAAAIREAPELLLAIHREYVAAGAQIITANTFRTQRYALRETCYRDEWNALTREAVDIARAASGGCAVGGSWAPMEDCYYPSRTPVKAELEKTHQQHLEALLLAGVDVLLVESANNLQELEIVSRLAGQVQTPTVISLLTNGSGELLSGDRLQVGIERVLELVHPLALCVNCVDPRAGESLMKRLKPLCGEIAIGIYANTSACFIGDDDIGWEPTDAEDPARYGQYAERWREAGACLMGGCCGTTPEHIRAIKSVVHDVVQTNDEESMKNW